MRTGVNDPPAQAPYRLRLHGFGRYWKPKAATGNFETVEGRSAGQGAWDASTILPGYELLGRYLGIFHDKVDISADDKIIEQLNRGRKYAAGITDDEPEEEQEPKEDSAEPKPN